MHEDGVHRNLANEIAASGYSFGVSSCKNNGGLIEFERKRYLAQSYTSSLLERTNYDKRYNL
jgi:hypothetical protein